MKSIVQHFWYVAAEKRAAAECDCQNVAEERWFRGGIMKHHGIKKEDWTACATVSLQVHGQTSLTASTEQA